MKVQEFVEKSTQFGFDKIQTHFFYDIISLPGNTTCPKCTANERKSWRTGLGDPERQVVPSEKLKTMFLKALHVT